MEMDALSHRDMLSPLPIEEDEHVDAYIAQPRRGSFALQSQPATSLAKKKSQKPRVPNLPSLD